MERVKVEYKCTRDKCGHRWSTRLDPETVFSDWMDCAYFRCKKCRRPSADLILKKKEAEVFRDLARQAWTEGWA